MKELTFSTLIAVFEEIFGAGLFWTMVALAALGSVAFVYMLIRDRGLRALPFVRAEVVGLVGGLLAVLFVQFMTNSGFGDIGGPIDLITVLLIWLMGAIGTVMVAYVVQGLFRRRPPASPLT